MTASLDVERLTTSSPADVLYSARLFIDAVALRYLWTNLWRSHGIPGTTREIPYRTWNAIVERVQWYEEDMRTNLWAHTELHYGRSVPRASDLEPPVRHAEG